MKRRIVSFLLALLLFVSVGAVAPARAETPRWSASQQYIDLLKSWEGFSATPYKDNSHYSIGYGTYCPDNMVDYYTKNPITPEQGEQMFREQLLGFENAVNNFIYTHGMTVQQHQYDALVSFSYNCGTGWMSELNGYFNIAAREVDTGAALIYGMGLWSTSGGKYILIRRRMREANMFINGEYGVWPSNYRYVFLDAGAGEVSYKICCFDTDLSAPLNVAFSKIPTGKDQNGNPFAYTFAGWYTESGKKVEVLDSSLTNDQTLYAKWADPQGNIVTPTEQVEPEVSWPRTATPCNIENYVNARQSADLSSKAVKKIYKGDKVTVYEEVEGKSFNATNGTKQKIWCRIEGDLWVPKHYLQYEYNAVTGIQLLQNPTVTDYIQPVVAPKLEGSILLVTYANGCSQAMTLKQSMISGFDGNKEGTQTLTVTHKEKTTTFQVTVTSPVPDTITTDVYRIEEGVLLGIAPGTTAAQLLEGINERQYVKIYQGGQEITGDQPVGTDAMVALMDGENMKAALTVAIRGDVSGDGLVDGRDATLLLQYAAGWEIPVNEIAGDVNGDDACDGRDATLLLQYAAGWEIEITQ